MTIAALMQRMLTQSAGNFHDINHLIKVWTYARTIGALEGLDARTQRILEAAAILHDIACPLCREKYGDVDGKHQEQESSPLVDAFLRGTDMDPAEAARVSYLVSHHHTPDAIDGPDYQILIEADYIVNAEESQYSEENIRHFLQKIAKTASGAALMRSLFRLR